MDCGVMNSVTDFGNVVQLELTSTVQKPTGTEQFLNYRVI